MLYYDKGETQMDNITYISMIINVMISEIDYIKLNTYIKKDSKEKVN